MRSLARLNAALKPAERRLFQGLTTPIKIQNFLDTVEYSAEEAYRAPLQVIRERKAHCYDGAVFAAAALGSLGHPPLLINMFPNSRDDEHLVSPFRRNGAWGAVGQSNFVGLRYREPIHRTLRELMISYFEHYYNVAGEKTMRSYTRPLALQSFDRLNWMTDPAAMDCIADRLSTMQQFPIVTTAMVRSLAPVDRRSYHAGLQGSNARGLYAVAPPPRKKR